MKNFRNFSSTLVSNLIVTLSKWLILILIARTLTPEAVGEYTLAFAITAPIALLLNMKLRSLYITEKEKNFKNYLVLRYVLIILSSTIMIAVSCFLWKEKAVIIMLVFLNKLLDLLSDTYYGIPHSKKDMLLIGRLTIIKTIVELLSFSIVLVLTHNLTLSLIVSLIFKILFVYFVEIKKINKLIKLEKVNWKAILQLLLLGLPLGLTQMLVSLNANISRYFIEYYEGTKEVGLFASVSYILVIFNLFASAISQYFLPFLNDIAREKDEKRFKSYLNLRINLITFIIGMLVIIVLFFFAPQILTILYGKEYAGMANILLIISLSTLLNTISWNYDTALMAIRYISIQPKIIMITVILNIVITYFLVKDHGIYGAAISLIIVSFIQLILRILFLNKKLKGGLGH